MLCPACHGRGVTANNAPCVYEGCVNGIINCCEGLVATDEKVQLRILVTGGLGYVGARLVPRLLDAGHVVVIVDNCPDRIGAVPNHSDALQIIVGDISHPIRVPRDIDVIVHLAALVAEGGETNASDQDLWRVNLDGTRRVCEIARQCDATLIFFSTGAVYGGSSEELDETAPSNPTNLYAETKLLAEPYVQSVGGTVLRMNHITGYSRSGRLNGFVNHVAALTAKRAPVEVWNPESVYAATHIEDVCDLVERLVLLERAKIGGKLWNFVGDNIQRRQAADYVRHTDPTLPVTFVPWAGSISSPGYSISAARIQKDLGLHARFSVEDAFRDTWFGVKTRDQRT